MFNQGVIAAAPEKVLKIQSNATEYRSTLMMKKNHLQLCGPLLPLLIRYSR